MSKKHAISPEDRALFRDAVGPVKRLQHERSPHRPHRRPAPEPHSTRADEARVLETLLDGDFEPAELDSGEELAYRREGVQRAVLRRLRRGQYRVGAVIDLHGMNVATARAELAGFLRSAKREHMTCVRIIHGKGRRSRHKGPVIKAKVNHWLRQRDDVLAFCSARPVDGGSGAVYVLLGR